MKRSATIRREGERIRGWVLYDARCPLCARGARRLGPIVVRRGFKLAPLQRKWVIGRLGMSEQRRMSRTWVLYPDGRLVGGADAYLELSERVWWAKPLAWIGRARLGKRLLDRFYFWVARNRHRISGACGLKHGRGLPRLWRRPGRRRPTLRQWLALDGGPRRDRPAGAARVTVSARPKRAAHPGDGDVGEAAPTGSPLS